MIDLDGAKHVLRQIYEFRLMLLLRVLIYYNYIKEKVAVFHVVNISPVFRASSMNLNYLP